ncbi:MAG: hypothetical protein IJS78_07055 [Clostridia bacterium]|nr:hypothetical protein [Clostridia bacterium]
MKRIIALFPVIVMISALICSCTFSLNDFIERSVETKAPDGAIPDGYTDHSAVVDEYGIDPCAFEIYRYKDSSLFEKNDLYSKASDADVEELRLYFSNFRSWYQKDLDAEFDDFSITPGDWFCIRDESSDPSRMTEKYDNYRVYFFDTETSTLYYIFMTM